jgi:hypothetical protein
MAYNDITPTKLGQAAITASVTTLYTVPASTRAFVKNLDIVNTSAGALTYNIFSCAIFRERSNQQRAVL